MSLAFSVVLAVVLLVWFTVSAICILVVGRR